jgi:site-specific recombinase XerD
MTDKAISPLRRRMIEDMTVRKFAPKTQASYIRSVKNFAAFLGRSPDRASPEDLRRFQLHLASNGASASSINATVTALRFLFKVTLRRRTATDHLPMIREPRKLPVVLSLGEIARMLDAAPGPKHKAALGVAYGAGLRASEVVSLKASDIDSDRMAIRVEQGKGRQDRYAMLSESLLDLLRVWWRVARSRGVMLPGGWLFPGQNPVNPLTARQLNRARRCRRHRQTGVAAHLAPQLRHPFARTGGRHSGHPGPARNSYILPNIMPSKGGSFIPFIRDAVRRFSLSGKSNAVEHECSSFPSRTAR